MSDKRPNILKSVTHSEDFIEQRKTARLDIPIKVEYRIQKTEDGGQTTEDKKSAVTKNVSAGGVYF